MKDTTKKTVPTGSTSKREHSTKNNETIANNENSAILCKSSFAYVYKDIGFVFRNDLAQANIVSTQSTINSATSDFSKENTIIQEPAQRLKTTDNIFSQANSQIPPISLSSRSIAQRLRYKRKRTTNSIEGEVMVLSDITNQVPSGTTHTRQSYLTATHDERTIANTRIHSTTSPTGTKTDYQVKGNPCASAKRLRKNDSFSSHSNLHTPPTSFPTSSIPLSDTTDVSPSVRTQTQQEVLTPTFESSKSRLTAKGDYYLCCSAYYLCCSAYYSEKPWEVIKIITLSTETEGIGFHGDGYSSEENDESIYHDYEGAYEVNGEQHYDCSSEESDMESESNVNFDIESDTINLEVFGQQTLYIKYIKTTARIIKLPLANAVPSRPRVKVSHLLITCISNES
ncbi:hypothetical protein YC2023_033736 [Brassica napus]